MKGTLPSPSPRRGAPWPCCASLTRRVFGSPAPLETAAGGAHGLPQVPKGGRNWSEHIGDLSLAEDLQEFGP